MTRNFGLSLWDGNYEHGRWIHNGLQHIEVQRRAHGHQLLREIPDLATANVSRLRHIAVNYLDLPGQRRRHAALVLMLQADWNTAHTSQPQQEPSSQSSTPAQ